MIIIRYLFLYAFLFVSLFGCAHNDIKRDILFQASTINALLEGVYDGDMTFGELKRHGDFGLGTLNRLDGEMLALNGKVYQIRIDGKVYPVDDSMKTPFAVFTFFETDSMANSIRKLDYNGLKDFIESMMPSKNIFYAIKVSGTFDYIKARSVPSQQKPYPKLVDAAKNQAIFNFKNVKGTLVGFYLPDYVKGVNVPGYHFHFIAEDRTAGGHLLDCIADNVLVEIDYTTEFYMVLPGGGGFHEADLKKEKQRELEKVEYNK